MIVLDSRWITDTPSGIGVYTREMLARLPRLAPDLRFHALFRAEEFREAAWRDCALDGLPNLTASIVPYGPFSPKGQWGLPPLLRRLGATLFHSPNYLVPYLSFPRLPRPGRRCIANIHDIIPLVVPGYAPASRTSKFLGVYRECVRQAVVRSHAVITGSVASKNDIMRVFRFGEKVASRLHVVFDGADLTGKSVERHAPAKAADDMTTPRLVIYVGRMDPYKNVPMLVDAFARMKAACPFPLRLKVIGPRDPRYPEAERRAAELGLANEITFTGFVATEELAEAYRTADLLAQPSRYEGFGLQIVEAMAAGTPVLCTDGGAQPEVSGGAAEVVPAGDVAAFANAAAAILRDPGRQEELRRLGKARAIHFTWDATANATLEIYRQTLQPFNPSTPRTLP